MLSFVFDLIEVGRGNVNLYFLNSDISFKNWFNSSREYGRAKDFLN